MPTVALGPSLMELTIVLVRNSIGAFLTILIFEEEKRAVFVRALVAQTWLDRFLI
jgi:hypothetical protein